MSSFIVKTKHGRIYQWYRIEVDNKENIFGRPQELSEGLRDRDIGKKFFEIDIEYDYPLIKQIQILVCENQKKCLNKIYSVGKEKLRTIYDLYSGDVPESQIEKKKAKRSDGKKKTKTSVKKRSRYRDGVLSRVTSPRRSGVRRGQPDVVDLTNERRQKRLSIKRKKTKLREKKLDNKECRICFEEFEENDDCIVLETCGHSYHEHCINPWLGDRNEKPCPTCRSIFTRNGWFPCHEIDKKTRKLKIKKAVDDAKKKNRYVVIHEVIDIDPDVIEIK